MSTGPVGAAPPYAVTYEKTARPACAWCQNHPYRTPQLAVRCREAYKLALADLERGLASVTCADGCVLYVETMIHVGALLPGVPPPEGTGAYHMTEDGRFKVFAHEPCAQMLNALILRAREIHVHE